MEKDTSGRLPGCTCRPGSEPCGHVLLWDTFALRALEGLLEGRNGNTIIDGIPWAAQAYGIATQMMAERALRLTAMGVKDDGLAAMGGAKR